MKASELLEDLQKIQDVMAIHRIDIQIKSPTGTLYSIKDIALDPHLGRLIIRTKRIK